MNQSTFLEWWHDGQWRRIGWEADSAASRARLLAHGEALAASGGGHYRIVVPSIYVDEPPVSLFNFPVTVGTS